MSIKYEQVPSNSTAGTSWPIRTCRRISTSRYETGWVTVPNALWDAQRSRGLYQQYIDQLAYADELGFDGMVLNEHHQNIYGLMPSPNLIAAALTQ